MKPHKFFSSFALCTILFCWASLVHAQPENIALDKPVTLSAQSEESYISNKDPMQLTDGIYAEETGTLWLQPGTVAWRVPTASIVITIDLEDIQPISGVSYNTAAGRAGVTWPSIIGIFVSNDKKQWYYEGDLVSLSRKNGTPPTDRYSNFSYVTNDLKTKGRYIALAILQRPYTVTDEIEVYAGDNAWLNQPRQGLEVDALNENTIGNFLATKNINHRISEDIKAIRAQVKQAPLSAAQKSTFASRLNQESQENDRSLGTGKIIKTILPINDIHRNVMATYGEVLAAQGVAPLTAWKSHRYDWMSFIAKPDTNLHAALQIDVLKNEIRSDSFLLTNAGSQEKSVELQLNNPPAGAQPGWLQVNFVEWTDTYQGVPVADALIPVQNEQGNYKISIPAGFTRKVWVTVDASKINPGSYKSTFSVEGQQIPFAISVSKIAMQRPRMSLAVFDNSNNKSLQTPAGRGITAQNKAAALKLMKSHFVDSPWAGRDTLPWPESKDFNAQNQLTATLDFSLLDEWTKEWPDARYYFVFVNAGEKETFAGTNPGTPEFNARLGSYAKVLSSHLQTRGIAPGKLALLINDEPGAVGEWQDDVIANWARAIKNGGAGITLISDPAWKRPDLQKNQEAITSMDIVMPTTQNYSGSPAEVTRFYENLRKEGKQLWLYACDGPVRLFNPQHYYRGQAWRVFQMGGKGMGFWAFNDTRVGKGMTSWNDYLSPINYAPAFLDTDTVYDSVHWNAVREGVEDFELLSMLQDAMTKTQNATLKNQAQAVLEEAEKAVTATEITDSWQKENQPELADQQLQKVRQLLEQLP